jgi:membrane associated rhomboid family serine protease
MRLLASFEDPGRAQSLDDLLSAADIPTLLRTTEDGQRTVWIVSEQDAAKATQLLSVFLTQRKTDAKPGQSDPQPTAAQTPQQSAWQHWVREATLSKVTSLLLLVSVCVALYTDLGDNRERVERFMISLQPFVWWSLFTPILLHFHPFHLLFNAFWLRDLGVPTERYQGSAQYAVFLLLSAGASNLAQLLLGESANFGGLSGVVYALVGYLWARGRFDPNSGIAMPGSWVAFFVGWMALGFTGLMNGVLGGDIANYCHAGGFAVGAVYGYIAALTANQQKRVRGTST